MDFIFFFLGLGSVLAGLYYIKTTTPNKAHAHAHDHNHH